MKIKKSLLYALILFFMMPIGKIVADNQFDAVVFVNNSIISKFELSQRIKLLQILQTEGDLSQKALDELISSKVLKEFSLDYNIHISDDHIQKEIDLFARQFKLTKEKFLIEIKKIGLAIKSVESFIESGLLLNEVIQYKFSNRANINNNEIDSYIINGSTAIEIKLSEIVLPFNFDNKAKVYKLANDLKLKIMEGATFEGIAKNYSKAASGEKGGDLGWVPLNQIPDQIGSLLLVSQPNSIIGPTVFDNVVLLYRLTEIREIPLFLDTSLVLDFAELSILDIQQKDLNILNLLLEDNNNCLNLQFELGKYNIFKNKLSRNEKEVRNIPKNIYKKLKNLDTGEGLLITDQDNTKNVKLLMLCSRKQTITDSDRELARQYLFNKRMNSLADGFIADLKAEAMIIYK